MTQSVRDFRDREQAVHEFGALCFRERAQSNFRIAMGVFFVGRGFNLPRGRLPLGAQRAQDHQRNLFGERQKLPEQFHRSGITPVHIVEYKHGRLTGKTRAPPLAHHLREFALESLPFERRSVLGFQPEQCLKDLLRSRTAISRKTLDERGQFLANELR